MELPADLVAASFDVAVTNVTATAQIPVAAPAAGLRYRIWQVRFGSMQVLQPVNVWACRFLVETTLFEFGTLQDELRTTLVLDFPGGYRLPALSRVSASYSASVAGPIFHSLGCLYTVEAA